MLAARCSHCGTVFRVVQDQLRVAGGLVRCGRCGEVFNAAENLIDVDAATASPEPHGSPQADACPAADHRVDEAEAPVPDGSHFELAIETPPPPPQQAAHPQAPAPAAPPEPQPAPDHHADAWPEPSIDGPTAGDPLDAGLQVPVEPQLEGALSVAEPASATEAEWRAEPEQAPSFMRTRDGPSAWQQPGRRRALMLAIALGLLLLGGQAAYTWRDRLAASAPGLRGPLLAACSALGCQIEAVRSIDSLAVDSSGLVRVERSNVYKLQVSLRNRAGQPVAVPALDVTLSDASGQLIARRVLRAAELGVTETTVAAGHELSLQATLQARLAGTEAIAGYTIELFYP